MVFRETMVEMDQEGLEAWRVWVDVGGCGRLQLRFAEACQFVRQVQPGGVTSTNSSRYPMHQRK